MKVFCNVDDLYVLSRESSPLVVEALTINGEYAYELELPTIEANGAIPATFPLIRFSTSDGRRFRPLEQSVVSVKLIGRVDGESVAYEQR